MFEKFFKNQGSVLVASLIFLGIFSMVSLALIVLLTVQYKLAEIRIAQEYSFQIAEAGLNYGRWRLAHGPKDYSLETKDLSDPEGGRIGSFNLEISAPTSGNFLTSIDSTGWYGDNQNYSRFLSARYGQKAFTFYAFLFDSAVWFGGNNVDGRVHSNDGIRMDATASSAITSANNTYTCREIHGCNSSDCSLPCQWVSGTGCQCPGVWGSGENQDLWFFPKDNVDFEKVVTDLADLKDKAENQGVGLFLPKEGIPKGYDLKFKSNGTVEIYRINNFGPNIKRGRWEGTKWKTYNDSLDIKNETLLDTYTLQQNDLIFVENDVWIRGTVAGRVTVVSAILPDVSQNNTKVVISDNILYNAYDGSTVLGIIAQQEILVSLNVPDDLHIDAVLMAQKGMIGRDYYYKDDDPNDGIDYRLRNSITTYGSMISKDFSDPELLWVCDGSPCCGFKENYNSYDPYLAYNPPPYFPSYGEYEFISWEEKEKTEN